MTVANDGAAAPDEPLAVIRSYSDLREALHARADSLGTTRLSIDRVSGVQAGYSGKVLGPGALRSAIGRTTFGPLLTALGIKLLVVEDPAAFKFVKQHEPKKKNHANGAMPTRKTPSRQQFSGNSDWGRYMRAIGISKQTSGARKRIARHAARCRWSRKLDGARAYP